MANKLIDFKNAQCSACQRKSINVRTEVLVPTEQARRENRIVQKIIFRCEVHLHYDVDEMERLAALKTHSDLV